MAASWESNSSWKGTSGSYCIRLFNKCWKGFLKGFLELSLIVPRSVLLIFFWAFVHFKCAFVAAVWTPLSHSVLILCGATAVFSSTKFSLLTQLLFFACLENHFQNLFTFFVVKTMFFSPPHNVHFSHEQEVLPAPVKLNLINLQ